MDHEQNSRRQCGVGKTVRIGKVVKVKGGKQQKEGTGKVLYAVDRAQAVLLSSSERVTGASSFC